MKDFIITLVLVCFMGFLGWIIGNQHARNSFECYCGDSEPCAFGPGIIGVRKCGGARKWRECEPDPKYRVGP